MLTKAEVILIYSTNSNIVKLNYYNLKTIFSTLKYLHLFIPVMDVENSCLIFLWISLINKMLF